MRLTGGSDNRHPSWLIAVVVFVVLVAIVQLVSRQSTGQPNGLQQQFAASPPAANAGRIELPPVPTNLVGLARTTAARVLGGLSSAPLNTEGQNELLHVQITAIDPAEGGLRLTGSVTNISTGPVDVSLDNFKFRDGSGTVYASSGSPATTLQAGQTVPLDISLPIPATTQLTLDVEQIGQQPIRIILLNSAPTPAP